METEKFLNRLEETLSQVVRQQEAICAELVGMRERVDALGEQAAKPADGAPTREELLTFLDQVRAGEALGEASTKAWVEASDVACVKGGLRTVPAAIMPSPEDSKRMVMAERDAHTQELSPQRRKGRLRYVNRRPDGSWMALTG